MKGAYKTSPRPSREFFSNNSYAYQSNGMSQKTSSPRSRTPERKIRDSKENNCIICSKSTQLCCFNCKRVYYCSADHQQIHWYITILHQQLMELGNRTKQNVQPFQLD